MLSGASYELATYRQNGKGYELVDARIHELRVRFEVWDPWAESTIGGIILNLQNSLIPALMFILAAHSGCGMYFNLHSRGEPELPLPYTQKHNYCKI